MMIINGTAGADTLTGTGADDTINGLDGNDRLVGLDGNDEISGGNGHDVLFGDDEGLEGGHIGNDRLIGGAGVDFLSGGRGDDFLSGGDGDDTLVSGVAYNVNFRDFPFPGASYNFSTDIDGGNDVIDGGSGVDWATLIFNRSAAINIDNRNSAAVNNIFADGVAVGSIANVEVIVFYGGSGDDHVIGGGILYGHAGNDILIGGAGGDTLNGGDGDDLLNGGDGRDLADYREASSGVTVDLRIQSVGQDTVGAGIDTLIGIENLQGSVHGDRLIGDDVDNQITDYLGGDDSILGMGGNDSINLSSYADVADRSVLLDGGSGSDRLTFSGSEKFENSAVIFGGTGDDNIMTYGLGSGVIDAGSGNDYVDVDTSGGVYRVTLGTEADTLSLRSFFGHIVAAEAVVVTDFSVGSGDALELSGWMSGDPNGYGYNDDPFARGYLRFGQRGADTILQIDRTGGGDAFESAIVFLNVKASSFGLVDGFQSQWVSISPTAGDDILTGTDGADTLSGLDGNDQIEGLAGDDILNGGAGNDSLNGGSGADAAAYADAISGVRVDLNLAGPQDVGGGAGRDTLINIENLIGSRFDDVLTGNTGANVLTGGAGNDRLIGGFGDDRLVGGAGIDTADYGAAAAGVIVNLQAGTATGAAGNDTLVEIENLIGSRFNDVLAGNAGANSLFGGFGDDILSGGAGEDLLDGGAGYDMASYADAVSAVNVSLRNTTRQNTGGGGVDTLVGIEHLEGSAFNDILSGDGGTNILTGGAGIDTLDYGRAAGGVKVSLAVTTRQATGGDGTDTISGFENLIGTAFDDVLTGDAGDNRLTGGTGNDVLNGGLGNDVLIGGDGVDTLSYAGLLSGVTVNLSLYAAQDTLGGGIDTLSGFENLTGTRYNDVLTGTAGANILSGDIGNDVIEGGAGDDRLDGGAGSDTASFATATAAVRASLLTASATGGAGTDVLVSIENLTGTRYDDYLTGDAGANTLLGGTGNDWLSGGAGEDFIDGGIGIDLVSYIDAASAVTINLRNTGRQNTGGAGFDTLRNVETVFGSDFDDKISGDQGDNFLVGGAGVDLLDYSGAAAGVRVNLSLQTRQNTGGDGFDTLSGFENLNGSAFDDVVTGHGGSNRLFGNDGNDRLTGGLGNDLLTGGAGNDRFIYLTVEDSGPGVRADRITDFALGDILDLSGIDANPRTAGINEAFVFGRGFTGKGGELLFVSDHSNNTTTLLGDIDGDALPDFSIQFTGLVESAVTANWVL